MSNAPMGFAYRVQKNAEVVIMHHGRQATVLRGDKAAEYLEDASGTDDAEAQEIMARITGNYRRGNERLARNHPRNG